MSTQLQIYYMICTDIVLQRSVVMSRTNNGIFFKVEIEHLI